MSAIGSPEELHPQGIHVRRFAWATLWLLAAAISVEFLISVHGKYRSPSPESYTMFWDRRGWLYAHLAGGATTIVLGSIQLLLQGLIAHRRTHRWIGRLYFVGMLVAVTGAVGLISTSPAPIEIRLAFTGTTLAWLVTATFALQAIYQGQTSLHRRWMLRNYLVTLAPVTFRLLLRSAVATGVAPSPGIIAALLGVSWALPLLAFEMLVRMPRLRTIAAD